MNLFGCKFCEKINDETVCDRKNFDTLLWSLVTVFQVRAILLNFFNIYIIKMNIVCVCVMLKVLILKTLEYNRIYFCSKSPCSEP